MRLFSIKAVLLDMLQLKQYKVIVAHEISTEIVNDILTQNEIIHIII